MELKQHSRNTLHRNFRHWSTKSGPLILPKQEHDRLINHFDRIAGHPKGADLLFYPEASLIRTTRIWLCIRSGPGIRNKASWLSSWKLFRRAAPFGTDGSSQP